MVKFLIALHVLVAVASIGPLIHAVTTAARAVRKNDAPAAAATVRLIRVYSIASVLAVVLGMGLLSMDSPYGNHEKLGSFGQTWIWLSVLLWLAAIGLAHALIVPALRPIAEGTAPSGGVATRVLAVGIVDALLLSAIVFLMIYQPGHWPRVHVGIVDPAATRELRRRVLRPRLTPDDPLPGDGTDAVHLGLTLDRTDTDDPHQLGLVVSTCLVLPEPCPWPTDARSPWRLMQMATRPDRRGHGYAGRVLAAAIELARERGADRLWCAARRPAEGLYLRHGFLPHGDWFVGAEDLPHRYLEHDLHGT